MKAKKRAKKRAKLWKEYSGNVMAALHAIEGTLDTWLSLSHTSDSVARDQVYEMMRMIHESYDALAEIGVTTSPEQTATMIARLAETRYARGNLTVGVPFSSEVIAMPGERYSSPNNVGDVVIIPDRRPTDPGEPATFSESVALELASRLRDINWELSDE